MNRLYIVRHGETNSNSGSGPDKGEKFRGWANIPLNDEGIDSAHQAGTKLENSGITHIFASDLDRTQHTAQIISQYTGAQVIPTHGLRPWNVGNLSGQPVEGNTETFKHYHDNPTEQIPGGETYNDFYQRWKTTLGHLMDHTAQTGHPAAIVTHTRNINSLQNILSGGKAKIPAKGIVEPGDILALDFDHSGAKVTKL